MSGCFEEGNEPSGSKNMGEIFYKLATVSSLFLLISST
jgi:hypothetical protein